MKLVNKRQHKLKNYLNHTLGYIDEKTTEYIVECSIFQFDSKFRLDEITLSCCIGTYTYAFYTFNQDSLRSFLNQLDLKAFNGLELYESVVAKLSREFQSNEYRSSHEFDSPNGINYHGYSEFKKLKQANAFCRKIIEIFVMGVSDNSHRTINKPSSFFDK